MNPSPRPNNLTKPYGLPDPKLNRRVKVLAIKLAELKQVSARRLFTKTRIKRISETRAILIYLLASQGYSREELGQVFNRHHSTITASVARIQTRVHAGDEALVQLLDFMEQYNARLTDAVMTKSMSEF